MFENQSYFQPASKLSGLLWRRDGKRKESFQQCLWNLNICIKKVDAKCLFCGDDISNDVITLGVFFAMFVYMRALHCFVLIGGNLTAQLTGSDWETGGGIQIPEM